MSAIFHQDLFHPYFVALATIGSVTMAMLSGSKLSKVAKQVWVA